MPTSANQLLGGERVIWAEELGPVGYGEFRGYDVNGCAVIRIDGTNRSIMVFPHTLKVVPVFEKGMRVSYAKGKGQYERGEVFEVSSMGIRHTTYVLEDSTQRVVAQHTSNLFPVPKFPLTSPLTPIDLTKE
jgi:hypothetical protein